MECAPLVAIALSQKISNIYDTSTSTLIWLCTNLTNNSDNNYLCIALSGEDKMRFTIQKVEWNLYTFLEQ